MSRNEWQTCFKGMPNSKKYWKILGNTSLLAQVELYYAHYLNHGKDQYYIEQMEDFVNRSREVRFKMQDEPKAKTVYNDLAFFIECVHGRKVDPSMIKKIMPINTCTNSLGTCKAATPTPFYDPIYGYSRCKSEPKQEQGNNPMRIENTTATAYITAPKSDDATSRDYLLNRLERLNHWSNPKDGELRKLFNMDATEQPETYQQLIDAIKGDKFTLDPKKVQRLKDIEDGLDGEGPDLSDYGYGPFYAMVFTDLPKTDKKGYGAAHKEYDKLKIATKDTIMVASPADGLKALQALEAWLPVGKAN